MKSRRNKPKPSSAGKAGAAAAKVQPAVDIRASSAKRWSFRFMALVGPLLLLGLLEVGLRLGGYGFPTTFFLRSKEDRSMLTDNSRFGWRFFPRAVARAPRPFILAAQKPPGTVRIFIFGESAAMGDPEPAYGFARQLERVLQARHPDQTVEVVNAAMTAINSHVIREIARDCVPRQGDFWLVYAGNNEVIGPYGAGTVFGPRGLGLAAVRLNLALKTTRIGQLLTSLGTSSSEPASWEGLELFLGQQVPQASPRLPGVYSNFASNLADIADLGRQSGATVVFATVPVNLLDCPPFASLHRPGLSPEQLTLWMENFAAGNRAQGDGHFEEALSAYRKADQIDGEFAQLAFQRGTCEMQMKRIESARADFQLACDLDTLRFRSDSRINEIIRQMAWAKKDPLIEAERDLARRTEEIPGGDFFYDHVHLNFTGNYRLAILFATELEKRWPGGRTNTSAWLTEPEVARRLAFTDFDQGRVDTEMRARLQQQPFRSQSNFGQRDEFWRVTIASLSNSPAKSASSYAAAIALTPQDWLLHANYAQLLEAAGSNDQAAAQWQAVARLLPQAAQPWASLGRLARLAGDLAQAEHFLSQGLKRQPDSVETLTEFGILEAGRGATEEARRYFLSALRRQPGFSAARVNLGLLLARGGDATGAAAQYREALRWHTNNVDALVDLANLLGTHGEASEAMNLYEQAVRLQPENPVVRYNLGRLLAANNRAAEAVTNLEVALQQRPELAEIHFELGSAFARLGNDAEALAQFAEAARLNPDLVDARFNYGVALARSGRYAEAVTEFRATLRLRPQHLLAQHMLDDALRATRTAHGEGVSQ